MGFWGSFVVARASGSLLDLSAVSERTDGLIDEDRHGPWQVGTFEPDDLADLAPLFQQELAAETGAPVLTAHVLGSDTAVVEAWHDPGVFWRTCLARQAARSHWRDTETFHALFLEAGQATRQAVEWSRAAGLEPDSRRLRQLFDADRAGDRGAVYAEDLVLELVDLLGLPPRNAYAE